MEEWRLELHRKANALTVLLHRLEKAREVELEAIHSVQNAHAPVFVPVDEYLSELKRKRGATVERSRVEAEVAEMEEEVERLKALIQWAEEPQRAESRTREAEEKALEAGLLMLRKAMP